MRNGDVMSRRTCPRCRSKNIVHVEYAWDSPEHWDGVSEVKCLCCGVRIGRWSGRLLQPGELEPRALRYMEQRPKKMTLRERNNRKVMI